MIVGYPQKAGHDATAAIGSSTYPMYTQNDGAWVKNAAEETQMVETMRRGSDLVVKSEIRARHQDHGYLFAQGDGAGARQGCRGVQVNIRVADARASSVAKPSASNMGSPRGGGLTTRSRLLGGSADGGDRVRLRSSVLPGAGRHVFEVLGRLAGGLGRENRDHVAPGRSAPDRNGDRRVGDQRKARQAEQPSNQTQNHGATVPNPADSNEFSAET